MAEMFAVARVEKFARSAVNGISVERNREQDDGRNYKNEIDKTATDCNITLKECKHFNNEISKQIKAAGVKEKPDSIVMLGGLYTASKDYFTKNEHYVELSAEQREAIAKGDMEDPRTKEQRCKFLYDEKAERFFNDCLQFQIDKYCQGDASRLISAKIDFDETTPHLQCYSVPLQERTNKKGITKMHLCAKQLVGNRSNLRQMQDDFYERVGKQRGLARGEKVDWDLSYAERKKHETTYEHNKAARAAVIASQEAQIAHNASVLDNQAKEAQRGAESLQQQENELARGRLQLEKQAKAAEALAKSKIKKNGTLFHKEEELPYKMNMKDYQNATAQVAAVQRVLDNPAYTPSERAEMQREADAARQAKQAYDRKASELDDLVEQRVRDRLALLNRTEPRRIEQLEQQLSRVRNDLDYVVDAIKMCLEDNGISIKDFERNYGVRITEEHSRSQSIR